MEASVIYDQDIVSDGIIIQEKKVIVKVGHIKR